MILGPEFYGRSALTVAPELVGAVLHLARGQRILSGRIVETEAYTGADDPASHAAGGPTDRCAVMFGPPGVAYVYLIYGVHHCLNVVTGADGTAGAVLIRAVEPVAGVAEMALRRGRRRDLANGPGKLCAAYGIDRRLDGRRLDGHGRPALWISPRGERALRVAATGRIGLSRAADRPWRFIDPASRQLSRPFRQMP